MALGASEDFLSRKRRQSETDSQARQEKGRAAWQSVKNGGPWRARED